MRVVVGSRVRQPNRRAGALKRMQLAAGIEDNDGLGGAGGTARLPLAAWRPNITVRRFIDLTSLAHES